MKKALRLLALFLLIGTVSWWYSAGKNPGWTKNQVAVMLTDEITGIEYPGEPEKRFIPGVDFLAAGAGGALALAGLSFLPVFRRKSRPAVV
ncbi:MAG: hypothetical protein V4726_09815 [Verrucomicrobiota bacterium]